MFQYKNDNEFSLLLDKCNIMEQNEEEYLNKHKVTPKLRSARNDSIYTNIWYLDNGESNHMTSQRDKF